jgi:uncharacterized protein YjbJ (UPF0337 family)
LFHPINGVGTSGIEAVIVGLVGIAAIFAVQIPGQGRANRATDDHSRERRTGAADKDRVVGSVKQVKGAVKQVVGKAVGDAKLESEGKVDEIEGKVQNVIGGLKDTLRGR